MLTTDRFPRGRTRTAITAASLSTALLLAPGASLAMDSGPAELDTAPEDTTVTIDGSEMGQLEERLAALNELNVSLEADNAALAQQIEAVTHQRDALGESLTRFDELYDPFEADRQLLVELRKGLPETRGEAEAQLDRLKRLSLASDPARLGQLVDRVADAAPAFLDWRFTQFATTQEASEAYISSGANAFDGSMQDLRNAVLLTVANRIDGLLTVLDRSR